MLFDRGSTYLYISNSGIDVVLWLLHVLTYQYAVKNKLIQPTENCVMWKFTHGQSLINYVSKKYPHAIQKCSPAWEGFQYRFSPHEPNPAWWLHQMETFSALLALCAGNSPVIGEFPAQRPVTRSFDVFFDLRPNKRLSKQSWGWWFEMSSCPLWRHSNGGGGGGGGANQKATSL